MQNPNQSQEGLVLQNSLFWGASWNLIHSQCSSSAELSWHSANRRGTHDVLLVKIATLQLHFIFASFKKCLYIKPLKFLPFTKTTTPKLKEKGKTKQSTCKKVKKWSAIKQLNNPLKKKTRLKACKANC